MKKQAICIQCHNKPEIINRIIDAFPKEQYDFFIHVDKKAAIEPEIKHIENVHFVPRVDVRWGRFSQVEATLNMLRSLDEREYCYIHLISGNDYPAISPKSMFDRLKEDNKEYIGAVELDTEKCTWSCNGADRYMVWYPQCLIDRPAHKVKRVVRVAYREFIMRSRLFRRQKFPAETFWGGSSWFSITGGAIGWIKAYLSNHTEYENFFKHGVCSDEVFFCTLLGMSPYRDNVTGDCKRFMIWEGTTSGGPLELRPEHIHNLENSDAFWCRKVTSLETIDAIEKEWKE